MFVDSHTHYDDNRYNEDRETLLESFPENGIDYVLNAASDMKASAKGIKLAERYDFFYTAVGVHPHEVEHMTKDDINLLENYCNHPKVKAVGEIGLDFYYDHSPRDTQRFWFKEQLKLACRVNLPVIIHSRDAAEECYETVKQNYNGNKAGVIHCYSGSAEMALSYIEMGFLIGIGGVVTFKNAKKLLETVQKIPLKKILLETDCPYLSPEPNRGKRNDSLNIRHIAQKISEIKQISTDEVANVTKQNFVQLFCI